MIKARCALGGLILKTISIDADWNELSSGYYITSGFQTSYRNAPKAYHYGLLIVFEGANNQKFQLYIPDRRPGYIYIRDYYIGWRGWTMFSGIEVEYGAHTSE